MFMFVPLGRQARVSVVPVFVVYKHGFLKAHVCKSRGHDVDMHGMASAFGI
jgi:hypothetical protein